MGGMVQSVRPSISRLTIVMWYSAFCIHVNQTPTRHVLGTQDFSSPKSITRQSVPVGFDLGDKRLCRLKCNGATFVFFRKRRPYMGWSSAYSILAILRQL